MIPISSSRSGGRPPGLAGGVHERRAREPRRDNCDPASACSGRRLRRRPHGTESFTSRTPPIRRRNGMPPRRSVAKLSPVRIGGSEQWLLERSEDVDNPVVLFVHGGPGTSQLTINRRNTRRLERDFVVVNWDQRGAESSYRAIHDRAAMTVAQIVEDTQEVVEYLLSKYGQNRLILVGHSWGSALGALTVARYPELAHCYLGIGQIANMIEGERKSYAWTLAQARQRGNQGRREVGGHGLSALPRRLATKDNDSAPVPGPLRWRDPCEPNRSVRSGAQRPVISPEYTCTDRVNVLRGISASMRLLWPQLLEIDLFEMIPGPRCRCSS